MRVVRVQVGAADAGADDPHDRVGGLLEDGSGTFSTRTSPAPYMSVARTKIVPISSGLGKRTLSRKPRPADVLAVACPSGY